MKAPMTLSHTVVQAKYRFSASFHRTGSDCGSVITVWSIWPHFLTKETVLPSERVATRVASPQVYATTVA